MKNEKAIIEMNEKIKQISKRYFLCKRDISKQRLANNLFDDHNPFILFVTKVNQAYGSLTPLEQNIINNDFFYESYPGWWMPVLEEKQYLYFKKRAMSNFLRKMHEID